MKTSRLYKTFIYLQHTCWESRFAFHYTIYSTVPSNIPTRGRRGDSIHIRYTQYTITHTLMPQKLSLNFLSKVFRLIHTYFLPKLYIQIIQYMIKAANRTRHFDPDITIGYYIRVLYKFFFYLRILGI